MVESIKAAEKPLRDIFCDDYIFNIPPYQRPYSWTIEEAGELLDDLVDATDETGKPAELSPYFLGSIVLIKSPDAPEADVVDGQQRLTTLTIMFSALRDMHQDADTRRDIEIFIKQRGNKMLGTDERPRLTIRDRDAGFFYDQIQADEHSEYDETELTDSQRNIVVNRDFLRSKLEQLGQDVCERLYQFAAQRCYLVVVEASDQASAYRVFSVLNNRGMDLSPTDILKADIIGAIDQNKQEKYTEVWESLEDGLGRDAFGDLFAHIRMIHRKQKMRGTLEAEFNEYVRPKERPVAFIDDELRPATKAFQMIRKASHHGTDYSTEINRYLSGLHLLDNQDWLPPAIKFISGSGVNAESIRNFLTGLDRLAYSMFIRRVNINDRLIRYGAILKAIDNQQDFYNDDLLGLSAKEQQETISALNGAIYETARTRKQILLRLDEALSDGTAKYDLPIIQIEHVLPQTPHAESEWIKNFPDEYVRFGWTHSLANLVLLSRYKNASAKNYDFEDKKSKYFLVEDSTPFVLTSQVIQEAEWTPSVLERRQERLMGALKKLWRLDNA